MGESELILNLLLMVVFGAITAAIASSKGRSALGWFFVGFFFPCIGLIVAIAMSNLREEEARRREMMEGQRRLREELKQERIKSGAAHAYTGRRLDLHDEALGMDTRQIASAHDEALQLEAGGPPMSGLPQPSGFELTEWVVMFGTGASRPLSFSTLKDLYRSGDIKETALVRTIAMTEWRRVNEIPGLLEKLRYDEKA